MYTVPKEYYTKVEEVPNEVFTDKHASNVSNNRMPAPGDNFWNPVNVDDLRIRNFFASRTSSTIRNYRSTSVRSPPAGPRLSNPLTPKKSRIEPKGVLLGEWRGSFYRGGLGFTRRGNIVYGS